MTLQVQNIVFDTHYPTPPAAGPGAVAPSAPGVAPATPIAGQPAAIPQVASTTPTKKKKKQSLFDRILAKLFFVDIHGIKTKKAEASETAKKDGKHSETVGVTTQNTKAKTTTTTLPPLQGNSYQGVSERVLDDNFSTDLTSLKLREQIQQLLRLPDDKYQDKMLTSALREYIQETDKHYNTIVSNAKTHIAPSYRAVKPNHINISGLLAKVYYTNSYPSYMDTLWIRDLYDFHAKWDVSFYLFPEDDARIKSSLKRKSTQLRAEINESVSKGITLDTDLQVQYQDVETIRQKLATHEERYFETGMYFAVYHDQEDKLKEESKKFEQKIAGLSMRSKPATFRMDEGFTSLLPLCIDDLGITRSTITSSLAGSFPFISQDLISKSGVLYGVNLHTGGLIIFDRFDSSLPNMNSIVLATSGAGKSFAVKLEILRYLLTGIDIIVIDPENEYKSLIDKVGGTYVNIATSAAQYINPFDLPPQLHDREYGEGDLLRGHIMHLLGLMEILLGGLTPTEEAIMDQAIQTAYSLKGITLQETDYFRKQVPVMEDLLQVLENMEGADQLALKLSKFVTGTFGKIFNNYTNINVNDKLTVFNIRDLEEALKTPAIYNVLNFIWTQIRSSVKPRLLIVDEAWLLLQNDIAGNFLFGLIKRARKYGVGITTITQDVEDLIRSKYGKPIVSNSSMQLLLKQSTSSIQSLESIVGLSEAEKQRLVASGIGEGLFFAGGQHLAIKVLASPEEKEFITTGLGNG